jgi:hypothetical protein
MVVVTVTAKYIDMDKLEDADLVRSHVAVLGGNRTTAATAARRRILPISRANHLFTTILTCRCLLMTTQTVSQKTGSECPAVDEALQAMRKRRLRRSSAKAVSTGGTNTNTNQDLTANPNKVGGSVFLCRQRATACCTCSESMGPS